MAPRLTGPACADGYDIPEVTPWGLQTVNVPGCSKQGGAGCDALLEGSIDVAVRTAKALNAHGKVPMYANPGTFLKPAKQNIWMNESKLVEALEGTSWMTYYESARAESMLNGCPGSAVQAGWCVLDNLLKESKLGVAAGVHTYYQHVNRTDPSSPVEDPLPHMAAFMLARVRPAALFPLLFPARPLTQRCGLSSDGELVLLWLDGLVGQRLCVDRPVRQGDGLRQADGAGSGGWLRPGLQPELREVQGLAGLHQHHGV